jgi:hypothetical protein
LLGVFNVGTQSTQYIIEAISWHLVLIMQFSAAAASDICSRDTFTN